MYCCARLLRLLPAVLVAWLAFPVQVIAQTLPPDPRFGIVEAFLDPAAASEAGAGYSRIILRWDVIQPAGPVDWKPANVPDPLVAAELAAGREVVGLLIGTPPWAATDPGQFDRSVPNMDDWRAFVHRMAQHYRGRIKHWVIWNEPDVWDANHPGSTWAGTEADYARLLKTAYLAIKDVDPALQVHVAGLTYFWDQQHGRRQYLDRLLDTIAGDPEAPANGYFFDAVVYHLYFNPLQTPMVLDEVRRTLARHGIPGKEIWVNETNAPPSDDRQEPPSSPARFRISLQEQAAFVLQEFALAFASGAQRVEVYKLRNTAEHPESIEPFGLVRGDSSRRPAFTAYRLATTYLRDFRSAQHQEMDGIHAVTFDRGAQTTTVLWNSRAEAARVSVRAIGAQGALIDLQGNRQVILVADGHYLIDLPGATCWQRGDCAIGGLPWLLVETGRPEGRPALERVPTPTPRPTPAPTRTLTQTLTCAPTPPPAPSMTPTLSPAPRPSSTGAQPLPSGTPWPTPHLSPEARPSPTASLPDATVPPPVAGPPTPSVAQHPDRSLVWPLLVPGLALLALAALAVRNKRSMS